MTKIKFLLNAENIELAYQNISHSLQDSEWWNSEKKRQKAIKIYKKLKLEKLFDLAKRDYEKYKKKIQKSLNNWCNQCINSEQWKQLRNSIQQAQNQISDHIETQIKIRNNKPKQEKNISLSDSAYQLLYNFSQQEKKSISDIIISKFSPNTKSQAVENKSTQSFKTIDAIKNTKPDNQDLKTHEKVKKGKINIIELWHYAGGQCQALSKVTQKRCKRITPELSIKHQVIKGIDYEFAVCHTHDNDKSQLDQTDLNLKVDVRE